MKNIKNIFKKNQVIIAALAIMIIVAGYLNFTRGKINNTGTNDIETNANISEEQLDIADGEVLDDNGQVVVNDGEDLAELENEQQDKKAEESSNEDTSKTKTEESNSEKTSKSASSEAGEAVLANQGVQSDYFVSNKLKREQTRSKNEETLNGIINNSKATDKQKQDAIDQMIALTDIKEKESVTETLLEAKGFTETLVTINDGKVEVVVNANNLTEQQIAQIEDVVKRKTGIAAKNIVITPVKVSELDSTETKSEESSKTESGSENQDSKKSEKSE